MCGIAGIVRFGDRRGLDREIHALTAAVAHRGPDGTGTVVKGPAGLGHRRLAVIDLESGAQPMSTPEGTLWITFNGEIYNYLELKDELTASGAAFATTSDTEVILRAYERWGDGCVTRFRGMFAFAILDVPARRIFLARDHFGIKPLYYRVERDYFAFASEINPLRDLAPASPAIRLSAIDDYLRFQYIPAPGTVFDSVFKLRPAHTLAVGFDGKVERTRRYWDFRFEPLRGLSEDEWLHRYGSALNDSIEKHLRADVPVGVVLSGGIDSTTVALLAARKRAQPLKAFAIGFDDPAYCELGFARQAAQRIGLELHTESVSADSLENLPELVRHHGEPFGDSSILATWHLARLARRHVPVVLSGDGADEGFAGYERYEHFLGYRADRRGDSLMAGVTRAAAQLKRKARWLARTAPRRLSHWERYVGCFDEPNRARLWREPVRRTGDDERALLDIAPRGRVSQLEYFQYMDYHTYLPYDILSKVDTASMYFGLEVRTPFIDVGMLDLARSLPRSLRMPGKGGRGCIRKYLPKKFLEGYFPGEFVHRRKQGFAIPRSQWFLPGGSGRDFLERRLSWSQSPLYDYFDPAAVRKILATHSPRVDQSTRLWLLLVLDLWLESHRKRGSPRPEVSA